jgi:hypothetical protein
MEEYAIAIFDRLFPLGIGFALGAIFYMYMYERHIGKPWKLTPEMIAEKEMNLNKPPEPPPQGHNKGGFFYYCCLDCQVIKKRKI